MRARGGTVILGLAASLAACSNHGRSSSGAAAIVVQDASVGDGTHGDGAAVCGNGLVEQGEDCDQGAFRVATCATVTTRASSTGQLECGANCTFDTSGCTGPTAPCVAFAGASDGGAGDAATAGLMVLGPGGDAVAVATDGVDYLVAWEDGHDLRARSVNGADPVDGGAATITIVDGNRMDPLHPPIDPTAPISTAGRATGPALTFASGFYYAAWTEARSIGGLDGTFVRESQLARDGTPVPPTALLDSAAGAGALGTEVGPTAIAPRGPSVIAAWLFVRGGGSSGFADAEIRVATPPDPPTKVSGSLVDNRLWAGSGIAAPVPGVASAGSSSLVAWVFGDRLLSVTVGGASTQPVTLATNIAAADYDARPAVASDGLGFLVAWLEADPSSQGNTVHALRADKRPASKDGGRGFVVAASPTPKHSVRAVFAGDQYLVAWTEEVACDHWVVRAAGVGRDGRVGRSSTVATGVVPRSLAVAATASSALFAYDLANPTDSSVSVSAVATLTQH